MRSPVVFQFAHAADEPSIHVLLKAADLPDEDIGEHLHNFLLARSGNDLVGCVGLEVYDNAVLLRSLAVAESLRGGGLGTLLTNEILRLAEHLEAADVYLLTLTAEKFFEKFGFRQMPREKAPEKVRKSKEFTTLCPATAVLMHKPLILSQSR